MLCCQIDARIYFLHVPKTGGTTMRLLLEQQLATSEIYPHRNQKTAKDPVTQELVSAHLPYWFCKKLDDTFDQAFKVTILREPVERYLSFLRSKLKADKSLPDLESVIRLKDDPNNRFKMGLIDNALCKYLSQTPNLEGEALLESAKEVLDTFDCVVFFDNFSNDVIDLFKRLGIELDPLDIPKINTTESKPVSDALLDEVIRANELDIQLYTYAKERLAKKSTTYTLQNILSFQPISSIDYTFDMPLQGRNWSYRETFEDETIYRWVMDRPAEIFFTLEKNVDYQIQFYARPLTEQVVPRLKVNGQEISLTRKTTIPFSIYEGHFHNSTDRVQLTFFSDKAFDYRGCLPPDPNRNLPPLSFAVSRIQVRESSVG